jgi:hypothetical protein
VCAAQYSTVLNTINVNLQDRKAGVGYDLSSVNRLDSRTVRRIRTSLPTHI